MDIFFPIQILANQVSFVWMGLGRSSYWGQSINFFVYDTIKIGLLLVVINFVMAATRYYFPMEKVRDILSKRNWHGIDYLLAALLGVVTPFCSCSSIPLFIGFLGAGIPLGVTFAFLISSPLVNESSLYLFPAMFGIKITLLYNLVGICVAMLGGYLIQKMGGEKYVKQELLKFKSRKQVEIENMGMTMTFKQLMKYFWDDGMAITKKIYPYVILGVGIGAIIHGFVPTSLVETTLANKSWWTIPVATILGAPLYANSVSVVPIMEALINKGVPMGTALAFMTSIVTVSIPELMILKKAMRWQLLAMFMGVTLTGVMLIGYVFNYIQV